MKSSAPVRLLKDLVTDGRAELQTGPFGTQLHASAYVENGVPVVAVKNIGDNKIIANGIPQVSTEDADRLRRYKLLPGDLLFSRKGAVERRAMVGSDERGWLQGSDCIRLRVDDSIDARYVSFVLGSAESRQWLVQHAHGATMPSLNQQILGLFPLPLPDRKVQKSIAHILGTLDDKIELNRQMNGTLDEIARTLFRSWFVTFDPVRAKAEGRQPEGMDAETADLFPDRLVDSELGPIPDGWEVSAIGDTVRVVGGSTPSTKNSLFWDGGTHLWVTPKDLSCMVSPILIDASRRITDAGVNQISSRLLPVGTVLLSSRAPVGYLAITTEPTAINQGFIAMICDGIVPNYYILNWARENMETIKGNAGGTTFAEISKTAFRPIKVIVPSSAVLSSFKAIVGPLYELMEKNLRESRTLADLRDTLLPELISGRMPIAEAPREARP